MQLSERYYMQRQADRMRDRERVDVIERKLAAIKSMNRDQLPCPGRFENFEKGCKLVQIHKTGFCKRCRELEKKGEIK